MTPTRFRRRRFEAALVFCLVFTHAPAQRTSAQQPADPAVVIDDVTLIDVEHGRALPHQTITIVGERIAHIDETAKARYPEGARIISGKGLYLMPGLFDAHVHYTMSPETFGPMLLANGVTAVRDTGADTQSIIDLREQSRRRGALMPHIICTGAIIDGEPPVWPFSEACDTPDEARAAVRKLKEAGVDMIKVYSRLQPEVYRAAVEEAHAQKLKATGHVPNAVTLAGAIAAGQDCDEHLMGFEKMLIEMSGKPADDRQSVWLGLSGWLRYPDIDKAVLQARLVEVAKSNMMQCPTLVVMRGIGRAADPEKANADERMAYAPVALRSFWGGENYAEFGKFAAEMVPHMQAMVGELHRAGVPLMIGTDLANPYVFAGFSVHDEMRMFEAAGISAADVLRSATIIPAKFCGVDNDLGGVAQGRLASLVLLRADPLKSIANAGEIHSVFVRGVQHDRVALDKMLADVRAYVADTAPAAGAAGVDMNLAGELVVRGRYAIKFNGQFDAGVEDFVITRDKGGFAVRAHSQPQGGFQAPALVNYRVDAHFKFIDADWKQLTRKPLAATYVLKDRTLVATANEGDAVLVPQEFALPDDALITAPVNACDFVLYQGLNLKVDETRKFQAVGFGFPSWKVAAVPFEVTRKADEEFTLPDNNKVNARRFASRTSIPGMGEMTGEAWTDEHGVMLRSVQRAQFGMIETLLIQRNSP